MAFWKRPLIRCRLVGRDLSLSLLPIILLLVCLPILGRLALWQLDRAAERKEAFASAKAMLEQPPIPLAEFQTDGANTPFTRVSVDGQLDWSRQFLLDNQEHNTVMGYEVLTPLILADGKAVLVSRGWLPPVPGNKPDLSPPTHLDTNQVSLTGLAVTPPPRISPKYRELLDAEKKQKVAGEPSINAWPIIIKEEDFAELSELLGHELIPRVLQPESIAFGFTKVWKPTARGPIVNYGYAAQWFGMMVALLGAVFFLNSKPSSNRTKGLNQAIDDR